MENIRGMATEAIAAPRSATLSFGYQASEQEEQGQDREYGDDGHHDGEPGEDAQVEGLRCPSTEQEDPREVGVRATPARVGRTVRDRPRGDQVRREAMVLTGIGTEERVRQERLKDNEDEEEGEACQEEGRLGPQRRIAGVRRPAPCRVAAVHPNARRGDSP